MQFSVASIFILAGFNCFVTLRSTSTTDGLSDATRNHVMHRWGEIIKREALISRRLERLFRVEEGLTFVDNVLDCMSKSPVGDASAFITNTLLVDQSILKKIREIVSNRDSDVRLRRLQYWRGLRESNELEWTRVCAVISGEVARNNKSRAAYMGAKDIYSQLLGLYSEYLGYGSNNLHNLPSFTSAIRAWNDQYMLTYTMGEVVDEASAISLRWWTNFPRDSSPFEPEARMRIDSILGGLSSAGFPQTVQMLSSELKTLSLSIPNFRLQKICREVVAQLGHVPLGQLDLNLYNEEKALVGIDSSGDMEMIY
jgi:hypothetical protein